MFFNRERAVVGSFTLEDCLPVHGVEEQQDPVRHALPAVSKRLHQDPETPQGTPGEESGRGAHSFVARRSRWTIMDHHHMFLLRQRTVLHSPTHGGNNLCISWAEGAIRSHTHAKGDCDVLAAVENTSSAGSDQGKPFWRQGI